MSKAKMLVPANLPGVQVPDGYMLVQQVKPVSTTASNSMPQPTYRKNWSRNQRKRERMEQLAAGGTREPARNPGFVPPPAAAKTGIQPVVAQPMSSATAEAGLSPNSCTGTESGDVVVESTANHPGYQTATAALPEPSIDDRQSIDSLLADDDGQDMEQEETRTQHPEQNVAQVLEVDGALPPPAVDELMVDSDMQNQEQDSLEP